MNTIPLENQLWPKVHTVDKPSSDYLDPQRGGSMKETSKELFLSFYQSFSPTQSVNETQGKLPEFNRLIYLNFLTLDYWRDYSRSMIAPGYYPLEDVEVELNVVREFVAVDEVSNIYSNELSNELEYTIFYKSDAYNRDLMDLLLDKEINVKRQHPSLNLSFHYIPQNDSISTVGIVSQDAKLIFSKL